MTRLVLLTLLGAACAAEGALPATAPETLAAGRVLVRLAPEASTRDLGPLLGAVTVDEIVTRAPLRVVLGTRTDAELVAARLAGSALVEYAVPERFVPMELRGAHVPNDPLFGAQWPLDNRGQGGVRTHRPTRGDVGAVEAWSYTQGSPDVLIAVLDDGIDLDHPDLAPNLASAGRDFTPDGGATAAPRVPADRHGTSVAGVAAARGDNGIGVSGICPRCRILPVRVHGSSNLGTAAAFRYAVEQGADIITNSWGYTRDAGHAVDDAVRDAIESAAREGRGGRGALIVFGVTNESVDNCSGPHADIASLDSVIAVGVANHDDEVGGSGFGTCLDLVAPSKPKDRTTIGVMTTDRLGLEGHTADDYFAGFGGTSAAAPLVAGIAGLLLSLNPELGRTDLQKILEHTAEKVDIAHVAYDANGFSERAGYGRVSAARALTPTVTITASSTVVEAGEPFSVTVAASAPFGLESIWWQGQGTGDTALDAQHARAANGAYVYSATWPGIVIETPGTYVLAADARDVRHAQPRPGYPHRASERAPPPTAVVTVIERGHGDSR